MPELVVPGDLQVESAVGPALARAEQGPDYEAWAASGPSRLRHDTRRRRRFAADTTIGDFMAETGTPGIRVPGLRQDGRPGPPGGHAPGRTPQVTAAMPRRHPFTTTMATMSPTKITMST